MGGRATIRSAESSNRIEGVVVPKERLVPVVLGKSKPREELDKYLDVPMCARGDLFYLLNLIATLEAEPGAPTTRPR